MSINYAYWFIVWLIATGFLRMCYNLWGASQGKFTREVTPGDSALFAVYSLLYIILYYVWILPLTT